MRPRYPNINARSVRHSVGAGHMGGSTTIVGGVPNTSSMTTIRNGVTHYIGGLHLPIDALGAEFGY